MEGIITLSIGLGLVVSMLFSEFLGIAAGGMVVPGYMALNIDKPLMTIITLLTAYASYFIVSSLSHAVIIYGRRRTVLMILIGFFLGWFVRSIDSVTVGTDFVELSVIGYIIPGLIAIWMDRQGVLETVTTLITSSIIVRFILILIYGMEISS